MCALTDDRCDRDQSEAAAYAVFKWLGAKRLMLRLCRHHFHQYAAALTRDGWAVCASPDIDD